MTKPGWQTTEFALCVLATLLSGVLALDVFDTGSTWLRIVGTVGSFLTAIGYTVSRTSVKTNALRALEIAAKKSTAVLLVALALGACGASAREKTIHAVYATTVAAQSGFHTYDTTREREIIAAATSLEAGRAALDAYRVKSDRVTQLFDGVFRAIATAAVLNGDELSLAKLIEASSLLMQALRDISGGKLP